MCRIKTTEELRSFLLYLASIKDVGRSQWNDYVNGVSDYGRVSRESGTGPILTMLYASSKMRFTGQTHFAYLLSRFL